MAQFFFQTAQRLQQKGIGAAVGNGPVHADGSRHALEEPLAGEEKIAAAFGALAEAEVRPTVGRVRGDGPFVEFGRFFDAAVLQFLFRQVRQDISVHGQGVAQAHAFAKLHGGTVGQQRGFVLQIARGQLAIAVDAIFHHLRKQRINFAC